VVHHNPGSSPNLIGGPPVGTNELHKTWSQPTTMDSAQAVSPILSSNFAGAAGVWESSGPNTQQDRSKMFFFLSKIFDAEDVRRAMASMPHETDPKVICKHLVQDSK
jgi:hypothetical protein